MNAPSVQPNTRAPEGIRLRPKLWALLVAMGAAIGVSAAALMALLRATQHAVWQYERGTFLHAVQTASPMHRLLAMTATGVAGGFAFWFIKRSNGWRAVEVNAAIWKRGGRLPLVQSAATAVLTMMLVGAGESLGRERSAKQAGALIGSRLAGLFHLNSAEWRYLTALGSATGMGAIYNMPIGGALFGLEVLLGNLSLQLVLPALVLGGVATACAWLVIPMRPTYIVPQYHIWLPQVLWAALAGPLFGVVSGLYVRGINAAIARRAKKNALLAAPVLAFAALGALAIPYPQLLGNGKDVVQLAFAGTIALDVAVALIVLKPLAVAGCLAAGMPGGLFTPTLTTGAVLGMALGAAWSSFWPGTPLGSYAMIGGGAMLAAATQGPISSIVMLTELTGGIAPILVPLAIASAGAAAVSRMITRESIFSGRV